MSDRVPPEEKPPRRRTSGSQKRDRAARVILFANAREKAEIEARAEKAGLSVSGYLRALAFGEETPQPRAARRPPVEKETLSRFLAELGKIGSNINQIARRLNQGKDFDAAPFVEIYAELREVNRALLEALGREPTVPKSKGPLVEKLFRRREESP